MKTSTKIIIATVLTLGIVGGAAAVGKHRFGNPEKRATHMVNYISDELNLDATQEQALTALKEQILSSRATMRSEMTDIHKDAKSLIEAEQFDRAQALEMITAKTSQVNSIAPELVGSLGDFLDSLNSEQKAQVAEFMSKHKHHRRHGH